jgi:hypothetical protein
VWLETHTFGYREQQPVVQTIAQNVSQHRKTPAALARSSLNASSHAVCKILDKTHGDASYAERNGKERIARTN